LTRHVIRAPIVCQGMGSPFKRQARTGRWLLLCDQHKRIALPGGFPLSRRVRVQRVDRAARVVGPPRLVERDWASAYLPFASKISGRGQLATAHYRWLGLRQDTPQTRRRRPTVERATEPYLADIRQRLFSRDIPEDRRRPRESCCMSYLPLRHRRRSRCL
jgi:hypothetical protein